MVRYLEAFFRNRWLISIPALLLLLSGTSLIAVVRPNYGGIATIWTERATYFKTPGDNQYVSPAQIHAGRFNELMNIGTVSRAVVDRLPSAAHFDEQEKRELAAMVRDDLTVHAWGERTVGVMFWHPEQEIAVTVVQAAIDQYVEVMQESADQQAAEAIAFYQERITAYETEILPRSGQAVTEFLQQHPELRLSLEQAGPVDPEYALLQQQAQSDRAQYEQYQQQLDEVRTQSQATSKSQALAFRIIDPPEMVPGSGKLGKKTLLTFAGMGTGLALGYAFLFVLLAAELDRTLRDPRDVQRRLHIPVLEVIEDYPMGGKGSETKRSRRRKQRPIAGMTQPHTSA